MGSTNGWASFQEGQYWAIACCRAFYATSILLILVIYHVPKLSKRLLSYGARTQSKNDPSSVKKGSSGGSFDKLLNVLPNITVSHARFIDFYILSVTASVFWATVYVYTRKPHRPAPGSLEDARLAIARSQLVWLLMFTQGVRRLVESETLAAPGTKSQMHIFHYIFGLAFYAFTGVAVWIESAHNLTTYRPSLDLNDLMRTAATRPLSCLLFFSASYTQHVAHRHLYELRRSGTYRLPHHWLFGYTLTPHYAAECGIYLALAGLASGGAWPLGGWNLTMLCALLAVVVNLGVTADGTRAWYERMFGRDAVRGRARMLPWLW